MKYSLTLLIALVLAPLATLNAADSSPGEVAKLPAFQGPTPGVKREIDMPLVDLSADKERHSVGSSQICVEFKWALEKDRGDRWPVKDLLRSSRR